MRQLVPAWLCLWEPLQRAFRAWSSLSQGLTCQVPLCGFLGELWILQRHHENSSYVGEGGGEW